MKAGTLSGIDGAALAARVDTTFRSIKGVVGNLIFEVTLVKNALKPGVEATETVLEEEASLGLRSLERPEMLSSLIEVEDIVLVCADLS